MPVPAPPAVAPSVTEAAENAALIKSITSEARASGKSLVFDPDAPEDGAADDGDDEAPASGKAPKAGKGKPGRAKDGKFQKGSSKDDAVDSDDAEDDSDAVDSDDTIDSDAEETDEEEETEGDEEEDADDEAAHEIDVGAINAALTAGPDGTVDVLALAKALGKEPEDLGVSPAQMKAIRLTKKKADQTLARANKLADSLKAQFGDQVAARRAMDAGEINPAIETVEAIFGMSWNDLNKAVTAALAGKPLKDLEDKRKARAYEKEKSEREAAEKKASEERAVAERETKAKAFITSKIKKDPLASKDVAKLLRDAGLPPIEELVFSELKAGYAKGLTDPLKALERVRDKLRKQAKALAAGGLIATPKPAGKKPPARSVTASRPRESAQRGAAGNAREMTDAELRALVLKEAGLGPRK